MIIAVEAFESGKEFGIFLLVVQSDTMHIPMDAYIVS